MRAKEGERQQGDYRLKHHVHRWPVPEVLASALEVPQDRGQQVVRVHARNPRRRTGSQFITFVVLIRSSNL